MSHVISKSPPLPRFRLGHSAPDPVLGDPGLRHLFSGRTAIALALPALGLEQGQTVLVPAYHCGSELDTLLAAGLQVSFYPVANDLAADQEAIGRGLAAGAAAVYVIQYFGYSQRLADIRALARHHGAVVIEDVALGLYSTTPAGRPLGQSADAGIYSYVKTLPVPDGGGLWLPIPETTPLPRPPLRGTIARTRSLSRNARRREVRDGFAALSTSERNAWDEGAGLAAHQPLARASRLTEALLQRFDHAQTAQGHKARYDRLHRALDDLRGLRPLLPVRPEGACPAFFPLLAEDPDALCRTLIHAGIEPVRFWRRPHPAAPMDRDLDVAHLRQHVIRLPIHSGISDAALAAIITACQNHSITP